MLTSTLSAVLFSALALAAPAPIETRIHRDRKISPASSSASAASVASVASVSSASVASKSSASVASKSSASVASKSSASVASVSSASVASKSSASVASVSSASVASVSSASVASVSSASVASVASVASASAASASTTLSTSTSVASASASATGYPFNRMVAFGDNLSDNGNGSYAWCIAAPSNCANTIYGHRTWTDGPVAVSYLSDMISTPLTNNFAIGHADGGSKYGSTIDNNFTLSPADVPSAVQQIANYTGNSQWSADISKTLHFLWTGNNDIEWAHADPTTTNHNASAVAYAAIMKGAVQDLINSGAKYIFIPNIYPKHIAPVMTYWTDAPPSPQRQNVADAIISINSAVETALQPFGNNVVYYDVYSYMLEIWNNSSQYNITNTVDGAFCDGYSQADWDQCVYDNEAYLYYWMQDLDMTTYVHKFIAQDMARVIENYKWT